MGSVSKHQSRDIDRISTLQDALLSHVLSFLPTKFAVRTSILSTRWKNVWASVSNLDFYDGDFSDAVGFVMFVDQVLIFRDSSSIQKFRLRCSCGKNYSHINGWIRFAIRRNIVELDLCVKSDFDKMFELPRSLFMCKTLSVLKLGFNGITYSSPPTSGCFPSLKFFHVTLHYPDNNSILQLAKVFSFCPVLEDLIVDGNLIPEKSLSFSISLAKLKSLRINLCCKNNPYAYAYSFLIDAPNLESVDLMQDIQSIYFLHNLKSLVKANIVLNRLCFPYDNNLEAVLLKGISNVKDLFLSADWATPVKAWDAPFFPNLNRLKLVIRGENLELLTKFLEGSPNLEDLILEDKSIHDEACSKHKWNPPEVVPTCLSSHLKTISIRGFRGRKVEMEMTKYFLKNGCLLDKMTIHANLSYVTENLYNALLMFQRASITCQVQVIKKQP